jgi:hypothetical protein
VISDTDDQPTTFPWFRVLARGVIIGLVVVIGYALLHPLSG